jgi:TM2 domain-containing membrane protein YozV
MKKIFTLTALTMFLLTATLNVANAAFPKDKQTTQTTVVTTATTTATEAPVATKKVVKTELKKAMKNAGSKSKIVAALLAFFLGWLGIHSFYMGNKKKGLIQLGLGAGGLILTIVGLASAVTSASTGTISIPVLAIIGYIMILGVSIWAFVDFIRILTGGLAPEEGFND